MHEHSISPPVNRLLQKELASGDACRESDNLRLPLDLQTVGTVILKLVRSQALL
jgi:hypothetical protein